MKQNNTKMKKGTLKRILSYITKSYKKELAIVIVSVVISAITTVVSSMFLRTLIDSYIAPLLLDKVKDFTPLLMAIIKMSAILVIGTFFSYLYNRIMSIMSQKVLRDIRHDMFDNMESLPIRYFDTHTHGDIMSRYTNDTDTLEQLISQSIPQVISSGLGITFSFCAMLSISLPLSIFVLIFTICILSITKRIAMSSSKYFVGQQQSLGKVNGFIEEMIKGVKVIKVFTHEEKSKQDFDYINQDLRDNMYKANKFANILMPVSNSLSNIEYVLVAIVGGILAIKYNSYITVGSLVSFLTLTKSFNQPINQMMAQMNSVIMALAGATRIFEMMDSIKEQDEGYVTLVNVKKSSEGELIETNEKTNMWAWKHIHKSGKIDYVELKGHIEFEDVSFGYTKEKEVLHNISLYAKPGQKIAFVGATGAGKTTITNLINRFYDINSGKIRYDGINIEKIKKPDLRRSLGVVLQDTNLFTGTIKDNIKYGKENATDEEVIEAAKMANAHDYIMGLPNGYDTVITENGSNLSGGQRQLLSIARVAINDPPVMILDEATSSIDTRTEKLVQDSMDKLMEGRTVFVIAHRLSTIKNAKAIMVLEDGNIIERGDHDSLIKEKGKYYMLYTGAFELE